MSLSIRRHNGPGSPYLAGASFFEMTQLILKRASPSPPATVIGVSNATASVNAADARGRNGSLRQELAAGMTKKRRTYQPRVVGDKVMMPADLVAYAINLLAPSRNA